MDGASRLHLLAVHRRHDLALPAWIIVTGPWAFLAHRNSDDHRCRHCFRLRHSPILSGPVGSSLGCRRSHFRRFRRDTIARIPSQPHSRHLKPLRYRRLFPNSKSAFRNSLRSHFAPLREDPLSVLKAVAAPSPALRQICETFP